MEAITKLIEHYGAIVVFLGCLAEGESVAVAGGFFAHQGVLSVPVTFLAALVGAFLGDGLLYLAGRHFADAAWIRKLRSQTGFSHALELAAKRPRAFVFCNRFVYGMRLIGGVAAGLAKIELGLLLFWNLLSSIVWACAFFGVGYFFGLGAEAVLGRALHNHQKLLIGLAIVVALLVVGTVVAKRVRRHEARLKDAATAGSGEGSKG